MRCTTRSTVNTALRRVALVAGSAVAVVACAGEYEATSPPHCSEPVVLEGSVVTNPGNVLSAVVHTRVSGADSVAVRYRLAEQGVDSVTPSLHPERDSAWVPVLGLLPESSYSLRVIAFSSCGVVIGSEIRLTTGSLPADLPSYTASGSDPVSGYVVFAAASYGLAIDNTGRVVWYHRFENGPGLNFQAQANGRYVVRPPTPAATPWIEIDPTGDTTRTLGCVGDLAPRFHDLIALPDGSWWVLCDEVRLMDLTFVGGLAQHRVIGTAVQHVGAAAELLFSWSPFEHIAITHLDVEDRAGPSFNWTHGNALDLDGDGNLIVSFRNLSQIAAIDTRTGGFLWRLGGSSNEFTLEQGAASLFTRQHGVRSTGRGGLLVLDNLGEPSGSRAERYQLDVAGRTLRLTGVFESSPAVTAMVGGTTQDLPGGHTLVSFGSGGRVEEYDAAGRVAWRLEGNPGYIFRAQRIASLYKPGVGLPR